MSTKCPSCKKLYTEHLGLIGTCSKLQKVQAENKRLKDQTWDLGTERDELKEDNKRLKAEAKLGNIPYKEAIAIQADNKRLRKFAEDVSKDDNTCWQDRAKKALHKEEE